MAKTQDEEKKTGKAPGEQTPKAPKKESSKKENEKKELEAKLAEQNDRYLRLAAEYDNFRKRSQKEHDALYGTVTALNCGAFLPVLDNIDRAMAQKTEDEAFKKGVELIRKQFLEVLEKLGVKEMEALGKPFDPDLHEAVMHIEDENAPENTVVEVLQKGYTLGERVVRHAIVKVAN